jgi:hypothetical protein
MCGTKTGTVLIYFLELKPGIFIKVKNYTTLSKTSKRIKNPSSQSSLLCSLNKTYPLVPTSVAFAVDQREHDHVTAPNVSKSS